MQVPESYLDKELLKTAVSFVRDGEHVPREIKDRVQMAISLDNRNHLIYMNGRLGTVENHFLHKLTTKRLVALTTAFFSASAIYIEESRSFLVSLATALLSAK